MLVKTLRNSLLVLVFLFDIGTSVPCVLTDTPPDPSSNCCGVQVKTKLKRNIGGEKTLLTEYPWLVLLEYPPLPGVSFAVCAGFLISGRHVITAAHCVSYFEKKPENVRLGDHYRIAKGSCITVRGSNVCTDGTTNIPIRKITVHPEYNRADSWHNDIAILELDQLAPYTDFIRPICLPSSDVTITRKSSELKFHFAGFGVIEHYYNLTYKFYTNLYSNEKRKLILPYKSNEECQRVYGQHNIIPNVTIRNTNICAGGEDLKGPCKGDFGGPLMYDKNGVFEAAGVFSFRPCDMKDVPATFTKIYEYQSWIRTVLGCHISSENSMVCGKALKNRDSMVTYVITFSLYIVLNIIN